MLKLARHLLLALILLFISFVSFTEENNDSSLIFAFQEAFRDISLAHLGLNYPDEEGLNWCIREKDQGCLRTFDRVMAAKDFMINQIRINPDRALSITNDTIFKDNFVILPIWYVWSGYTNGRKLWESNTRIGAIIALYYFEQNKEDMAILERARKAGPDILNDLFAIEYEWQHNRPQPERWVQFVKEFPEKDQYQASFKQARIQVFRGEGYYKNKKFGIMLERPLGGRIECPRPKKESGQTSRSSTEPNLLEKLREGSGWSKCDNNGCPR